MLIAAARHLIRAMPVPLGTAMTQALATRTRPARVHPSDAAAMAGATRLGDDGGRAFAWSWGSGPLVLLVHGWGGRASQMAPLAAHIASQGFRAVAFDVTGHGESPVRRSRWDCFLHDIASVLQALGAGPEVPGGSAPALHACVGHSAGGLTMMALRRRGLLRARRYVCVCAPGHPFPPVEAVRRQLDPPPAVLRRYQGGIASQFGLPWEDLAAGAAFAGAGRELLLVYDRADRYIDHGEGDRLQTLCPQARLLKTEDLGHVRILSSPQLAKAVSGFLLS
jgi:pimeloyl-ACP methyl ester carboxylesterase